MRLIFIPFKEKFEDIKGVGNQKP